MKKIALCTCVLLLHLSLFAQLTFRLTSVPSTTPVGAKIYIAGTFNAWNPGDTSKILAKQADGSYKITLTLPAGAVQYKYTLGDWATVEGNASGGDINNRIVTATGTTQNVDNQVLTWKGGTTNSTAAANVRVITTTFAMPQLGRTRRIWIYLPPQYSADSTQRFPVFYMHDGQNLFDRATSFAGEWQVDETLNTLATQGDKGCIVVGVDNGGASRIDEYTAYRNPTYGGGQGNAYARFMVETLKPYIDNNFRTKPDRLNTAVGGSSLGGLISMYIATEYQQIFSKALVFSPSFWYNDSCFTQVRNKGKQFPMRYYFMAGQNESSTLVNEMTQMTNILRNAGYTDDNFKTIVKADGQHSEWFWAREFGDGYKWLFRAETTPVAMPTAKHIKIYPNPTDSMLTLETGENNSYTNVLIYNMNGQLMNLEPLSQNGQIDVSYLTKGTYIIYGLRKGKWRFTERFTKL